MLKTVWFTQKSSEKGVAMLLGGFDGLHIGHRKLLACAKQSGLPVGIMTIVGGKSGNNLFTFEEREEIFKRLGVDFAFELPFLEIKDLSPDKFLRLLSAEFAPKVFVCGEDFRFGFQAQGTPNFIKEHTQVRVECQSLVEVDGRKVSATSIKNLLKDGKVEKANKLLGGSFFLLGKVEKDRQKGRELGFPTANIRYPKEKFSIQQGVYQTQVEIGGVAYKGITNYGARPTFEDEEVWTETYLDGFEGDLYGKELKIEFVRRLRDIRKFADIQGLKTQLKEDIRRVREDD